MTIEEKIDNLSKLLADMSRRIDSLMPSREVNENGIDPKKYYTFGEVMKIVGVKKSTLNRRINGRFLNYTINPATGRKTLLGKDLISAMRRGVI